MGLFEHELFHFVDDWPVLFVASIDFVGKERFSKTGSRSIDAVDFARDVFASPTEIVVRIGNRFVRVFAHILSSIVAYKHEAHLTFGVFGLERPLDRSELNCVDDLDVLRHFDLSQEALYFGILF